MSFGILGRIAGVCRKKKRIEKEAGNACPLNNGHNSHSRSGASKGSVFGKVVVEAGVPLADRGSFLDASQLNYLVTLLSREAAEVSA